MIFSRPLEHLSNQSTPIGQHGFQTFTLRILFETFVAACFTKRTLRIWDFSLPTKSSQIPLSPRYIGTTAYLITATGISACDIWCQSVRLKRIYICLLSDWTIRMTLTVLYVFSLLSLNADKDGEPQRRGWMGRYSLRSCDSRPSMIYYSVVPKSSCQRLQLLTHYTFPLWETSNNGCHCWLKVRKRDITTLYFYATNQWRIIWIGQAWSSQLK